MRPSRSVVGGANHGKKTHRRVSTTVSGDLSPCDCGEREPPVALGSGGTGEPR